MHLALHLLRLGASDRRGHGDRLVRVRGGVAGAEDKVRVRVGVRDRLGLGFGFSWGSWG